MVETHARGRQAFRGPGYPVPEGHPPLSRRTQEGSGLTPSRQTDPLSPCQTFARSCPQSLGEASTPLEAACCGRENLPPDWGCLGATQLTVSAVGVLPVLKGAGTCATAELA